LSYTQTTDGHSIIVNAPAYSMNDVQKAMEYQADGIGLLSTDFIYLNRKDLPDEEELYETLCQAIRIMGNKQVTVRLMNLPPSRIQALGGEGFSDECRGTRLGLVRPDILKTQLRAFYRATANSNLRLLLPMVSDVSEVLQVKDIIIDIQKKFTSQKTSFNSFTELGIEVEIPAAVVMAPVLSFEVSFFSIGKQLQFRTLAANNDSSALQYLTHDYAPSFLFQISSLAEEVRKRRKSVCITAPLAGLLPAIPILVAMGANELVIEPEQVGQARRIISQITVPKAKLMASKAMSFRFPDEIQRYAKESLPRLLK